MTDAERQRAYRDRNDLTTLMISRAAAEQIGRIRREYGYTSHDAVICAALAALQDQLKTPGKSGVAIMTQARGMMLAEEATRPELIHALKSLALCHRESIRTRRELAALNGANDANRHLQ